MRYQLRQGEELLEQGFNSKDEVKAHIEQHLNAGGLDWRAGYAFKARTDKVHFDVIVVKTGLPLKA